MHGVREFVTSVRPSDNIVLLYETMHFKHRVLFTYLKSAFEVGMPTLYLSHKEPATRILRYMQSFGIEVKRCLNSGLLELWEISPNSQPSEVPLTSHHSPFSESTDAVMFKAYFEGMTTGKRMVVVSDDPIHNMDPAAVVDLEKLNSERLEHMPISLVCTYSLKEICRAGRLFLDLILTHRHLIIQTHGAIISLMNGKPFRARLGHSSSCFGLL